MRRRVARRCADMNDADVSTADWTEFVVRFGPIKDVFTKVLRLPACVRQAGPCVCVCARVCVAVPA